jgi:hypothetical protein
MEYVKNQRKRSFQEEIETMTVEFWITRHGWHGQDPT